MMSIFGVNNNLVAYRVNKVINSNMQILVQNGEIVVKAPWYMSYNKIQEAVENKTKWILEKLNEYEKNIEKKQSKIVKIFGKNYKLNINYQNVKNPELNLEDIEIKVILPLKYKKAKKEVILKNIVDKMYEQIAQKEIEQIMEKTRIMLKIAPENYKIKKMNKVIAKTENQNEIIINPEIISYNKQVIEYIIAHEFCHLKYKTHSKGFYEMLNKNFKNYKEIQNYIKEKGIKM